MITGYFKTISIKIIPPDFYDKNNWCQFQVVSWLNPFMHLLLSRSISNNFLILHQHTTQSLIGSITKNIERLIYIRDYQNWSISLSPLQLFKTPLKLLRPCKSVILSGQLSQRSNYLTKAFYKPPVISCYSYLYNNFRTFPL